MLSLSKHALWGLLLALAGCAKSGSDEPMGEAIACALDGAMDFVPNCRVERQIVTGGTIIVVRHPDGGFRRFEIEGDWVRTADGLDASAVDAQPGGTAVTVGTDRYLLPPPAAPVDARRP